MSLILPFSTIFVPSADMSPEDYSAECARLFARQQAIDQVLHGELDDDVLYDLLAEDDIEPTEWAEQAIENVEFLIGMRL